MSSMIFDTHAYVKKLKATGFTEEQAEVQSEVLLHLIEDRLATREDVQKVAAEVQLVRAELNDTREQSKSEITGTKDQLQAEIVSTKDQLQAEIVSTKDQLQAEIASTKEQLEAEITRTREQLEKQIRATEERLTYQLTIRLGAMLVVAIGVMATLVKLL